MRYLQCKCGQHSAWSSMGGGPDCGGCQECGTTLAEGPNGHRETLPHDYSLETTERNPATGEIVTFMVCSMCHRSEWRNNEIANHPNAGA